MIGSSSTIRMRAGRFIPPPFWRTQETIVAHIPRPVKVSARLSRLMERRKWRETLADTLGMLAMVLVPLDYLRPSLLFLPTIAAGGDTPCHYPTAAWFHEHLLPAFRLHGWYPGAYLGQPLLLYYFPLPLFTYASFRLMRFQFPAPLLGAAASLVFLFLEENPIWGGTIASTLTGEFSYTYGIGLA